MRSQHTYRNPRHALRTFALRTFALIAAAGVLTGAPFAAGAQGDTSRASRADSTMRGGHMGMMGMMQNCPMMGASGMGMMGMMNMMEGCPMMVAMQRCPVGLLGKREALGLTAGQVQQLEALAAASRPGRARAMEQMRSLHAELARLAGSEQLNEAAVRAAVTRMGALHADMLVAMLRQAEQAQRVLTPAQQQKLRTLMQNMNMHNMNMQNMNMQNMQGMHDSMPMHQPARPSGRPQASTGTQPVVRS